MLQCLVAEESETRLPANDTNTIMKRYTHLKTKPTALVQTKLN